jgi:RNA polymerase sigma factor (sigma-70 family)
MLSAPALLVRHLRDLAAAEDTDRQLLECYLGGDGNAFAALVRRHGPMVLGVCHRVLGHHHDAEDAFQATFLTLARRPGGVRNRDAVGSWLHGVALRVAWKARRARRRSSPEVPDRPAPEGKPDWQRQELAAVLDEEVERLPAWCREPFVLCHLEGRSAAEAARLLGCPRGTVLSRVARARQRLARRLAGRGITPSSLVVPAGLLEVTANLGARLLRGEAVATLVSGRVLLMTLTGGKMSRIIVLLLALLGGAGIAGASALRGGAGEECQTQAPLPRAVAAAAPAPLAEAPPRKKPVQDPRLEATLDKWAKAADAIKSGQSRFKQTMHDKAFNEQTRAVGTVQFAKPHLMRLDRREEKEVTILLITERTVHLFKPRERTELIFSRKPTELPVFGKLGAKVFRSFLQGMTWLYVGPPVRELRRDFRVRLVKEDRWYAYLEIRPRRQEDSKDFTWMRIVLMRDGYWVRQVWAEHPNGNEVTTDFDRPDTRAPVTETSIRRGLPRGWKKIEATRPPNEE